MCKVLSWLLLVISQAGAASGLNGWLILLSPGIVPKHNDLVTPVIYDSHLTRILTESPDAATPEIASKGMARLRRLRGSMVPKTVFGRTDRGLLHQLIARIMQMTEN